MKRVSAYLQIPSLTYMPGRFGQWITYQDNKTIQEMLFSGEAREAYLDSFLSGFALGFPSAGIDTVLLENRGYSGKAADAALDIPAPAAPVGALTDGGLRGVKALSDGKTPDVSTAAADGGARAAEILKNQAQTPSAPRAQLNDNVRAQTSVTPQLQADMQASDRAADTVSNSADAQTDIRTDTEAVPVRYEDALRDYLESGLDSAAEPDVGRSPSSGVDTLQSAELNSDLVFSQDTVPETTQEAVPKTKEQLISELAPKISKPGITPGRATIEAQRLYAEVEQRYGENAEVILEQFESGQNPRKFLDGFQNAYIAGKLANKATLENSTAAAYLTEEQREAAYTLGGMAAPKASVGTDNGAESISSTNPEGKKTDLLSILEGGTIEEKRAAFKKAFQEGKISTRISPQKQARHIRGTKAFLNYDVSMMRNGDHPSYIREDLSENDLNRLVVSRMQGVVRIVGNHYYEYVYCDEIIGYYYSKNEGRYLPTKCAQIAYALGSKNIHIIPVKKK